MTPLWLVLLLTTLAGITIPLGAYLARIEKIRPLWLEEELRHAVTAFGGGVLLAAVAFVLVPEGTKHLALWETILWFVVGGGMFCGMDIMISRMRGSASNLIAMLADFLPEAVALGAALGMGRDSGGLLLAILIALQNLPESFSAYREIAENDPERESTLLPTFIGIAFLGPIAGLIGLYGLSDAPHTLGAVMLIGASGILYLMFQDIAPQVELEKRWGPPLGAVLGFLVGLIGHLVLS